MNSNLEQLTKAAARFQPFYSALVKHGYEPTIEEFTGLVYGRAKEKGVDAMDYYLREKTVKMHPAIDTMPIEDFMKRNMIKLPDTCKEIIAAYTALPGGRNGESVLRLIYCMEIVEGLLKPKKLNEGDSCKYVTVSCDKERIQNAEDELQKLFKHLDFIETEFGIGLFDVIKIGGYYNRKRKKELSASISAFVK